MSINLIIKQKSIS